jgi:hypothetical protein
MTDMTTVDPVVPAPPFRETECRFVRSGDVDGCLPAAYLHNHKSYIAAVFCVSCGEGIVSWLCFDNASTLLRSRIKYSAVSGVDPQMPPVPSCHFFRDAALLK